MATSVRLSPEIEHRINILAAETGRSKAYYLRELIEDGLDELEDYYLSEKVMERMRKGEEKTYSLDEVEQELGLAN